MAFPIVLALLFLVLHIPYLPKSLEDLDSINFALGVRRFDVAHHQPHPPGYPVYIALARGVHALVPDEARALGMLSVISGAIGVLAISRLFRRIDDRASRAGWTAASTAVAVTSPLYYFSAVRPLSDATGLAAAIAIQAMTVGAAASRTLVGAAFCAGLATGIRSQVAWLTVPLIAWRLGLHWRRAAAVALAFVTGALIWAVPLAILSGGIGHYWHALVDQGAEDLGNIQMLWTHHAARDVADALYYAFVAPWAQWWIAALVLVSAALGFAQLGRHQRHTLAWLAVAFVPYLVLDLLFQETFTSRYALPLVLPVAYLAVAGLRRFPREAAVLLIVGVAAYDAHVGGTSIAAYASQKAPAFRLLDDMRDAAAREPSAPVLAPDRRESLDLRRPIAWVGEAMARIDRQLPAPPQHEWLEAVAYWNTGGRAPVWFVVDPMRTTVDLVQHEEPPRQYRWSLPYPVLISGVRPSDVDWYRVERPEWYVGEGWALTPESAGVAETDGRGLAHGPIEAWVDRGVIEGSLLIGGRNFDATSTLVTFDIEGVGTRSFVEPSGAFLHMLDFPHAKDSSSVGSPEPLPRHRMIAVRAAAPARVAIEQFDASAVRPLLGFGPGWHEQEFNPRSGARWRWLSERAELVLSSPSPPRSVTLHIEGESPRRYFSRDSRLTVRVNDETFEFSLSSDFSLNVPVGAAHRILLQTDQTYVPAARRWRGSGDRRHLGLRIFKCELR